MRSGRPRTPPAPAPPAASASPRASQRRRGTGGVRRPASPALTSCRAAVQAGASAASTPASTATPPSSDQRRAASSGTPPKRAPKTYCSISGRPANAAATPTQQAGGGAQHTQHHAVGQHDPAKLGGVPARHRDQRQIPSTATDADGEGRPDQQHDLQQPEAGDQRRRSLRSFADVRRDDASRVRSGGRREGRAVTTTPRSLSRDTSAASTVPGRSPARRCPAPGRLDARGPGVQRHHRAQVVGKLDHPDHACTPCFRRRRRRRRPRRRSRRRSAAGLTATSPACCGARPARNRTSPRANGSVRSSTRRVHHLVAVRAAQGQRDARTHLGDPAARPEQRGQLGRGDLRGELAVAGVPALAPLVLLAPGCRRSTAAPRRPRRAGGRGVPAGSARPCRSSPPGRPAPHRQGDHREHQGGPPPGPAGLPPGDPQRRPPGAGQLGDRRRPTGAGGATGRASRCRPDRGPRGTADGHRSLPDSSCSRCPAVPSCRPARRRGGTPPGRPRRRAAPRG